MSTIQTANMGLVLPVPTSEPGPSWAVELNTALGLVDAHDHSSGKGVPITPAGIFITADLAFNSSNAISLRSARFISNGSPLSNGSDALCSYVSGVDLYYNDGTNTIRITQAGAVSGSTGTITGLPTGTASAAYVSGSGTFQFQQATSTGANLDVASLVIRYPGSYPSPTGNYILLQAPSSLSSGYSITLPALPASNNSIMLLSTAGVVSSAATLGQSSITVRSTSTTATAGNVLRTASSGQFNTTSSSYVTVGCSGAITTLGNPVQLLIQSDGSANPCLWGSFLAASQTADLAIYRGGVLLCSYTLEIAPTTGGGVYLFPNSIAYLDTSVNAGTSTYDVRIKAEDGNTAFFNYGCLVAYEVK